MDIRELLSGLTGAQRVYGEPYERDGITVIPASVIRGGGGFGNGNGELGSGEGGGGGINGRPIGAYVIKDGEVRWEPALDVGRLVLGGQLLVALLALLAFRLLRRRK
ncbi:spore germination protein GerW family protein [Acrocarpospora sp. B8E8]|uniref:spore germination protein GerW family protein n=1 Tax=Acrocarpospora sp. B8E8 TaxID=3153572 RepID=UPI00325F368E